MRNIDDGDAVVPEAANDTEQALSFLLGQRRCRLVKGKYAQASTKRPHDFHELSLGRRGLSRSHPRRKVFLKPEFGKHGDRSSREVGSVEEETVRSPEVAEKEILGDRQVRNNIRLLVNHPNSEGVGVGW